MKSLNEIVAELRMGDDGGKPAYRIGRTDKVDVSMPSGTPVRSYVIECVTIKELADWIEAAVARERGPCNAAAMREALIEIDRVVWDKKRHTKEETEAHRLATEALTVPARQCDVGTPDEKYPRWVHFCEQRLHSCHNCECKSPVGCTFKFGDMPYAEEEGGAE